MSSTSGLVFGLREQIASRLRDDVLSGRLAEGERLSELGLVERFRVSRTPIREALMQLTHEGLLEAKPNCGVRVASSAPDSIRDLIIPVRRTLETYALQSYFDDINESDFQQWDEILNRLKDACQRHDYPAIAEHDLAFHRSIVRRAEQRDLEAIWSAIVARVRRHFMHTQKGYAEPMDIYAEHAAIVETFRQGDKKAAVESLGANIA